MERDDLSRLFAKLSSDTDRAHTNGFVASTIQCWARDCDEELTPTEVQLFATAEVFNRYDLALVHQLIHAGQTYLECAYDDCDGRGWYDEAAGMMYAQCGSCHRSTCIACNIPWHGSELCPQGMEAQRLRDAEAEAEGEAEGEAEAEGEGEEAEEAEVEASEHDPDAVFQVDSGSEVDQNAEAESDLTQEKEQQEEGQETAEEVGIPEDPPEQEISTTPTSRKRRTFEERARAEEQRNPVKKANLEEKQRTRDEKASERARRAEQRGLKMDEQWLENEAGRVAYRQEEEAMMQRHREKVQGRQLVKEITKRCPKCESPIQKNGGCDHMTW